MTPRSNTRAEECLKDPFSSEEKAQRLSCALEATYEIESISRHLAQNLPDDDVDQLFLRSLVLRLHQLNSIAMSVLGSDSNRGADEMQKILTGGFV